MIILIVNEYRTFILSFTLHDSFYFIFSMNYELDTIIIVLIQMRKSKLLESETCPSFQGS